MQTISLVPFQPSSNKLTFQEVSIKTPIQCKQTTQSFNFHEVNELSLRHDGNCAVDTELICSLLLVCWLRRGLCESSQSRGSRIAGSADRLRPSLEPTKKLRDVAWQARRAREI